MYQSSNMFHPHSCPCDDEENYYERPCHPVDKCCCDDCCKPHPSNNCNCNDPDNYYQRPCTHQSHSCASNLSHALCEYKGKKVIICINGMRIRVVICEVCDSFVKALRIGCGNTLYINICKIDDIHISC